MTDHLVSCACTECSFRALCEEQARTIADLVAERDEAKAILADMEWSWDGSDVCCLICRAYNHRGHTPDCRLARVLGRETR